MCGECQLLKTMNEKIILTLVTLVPLPSCSHSSGHTLRGCNACATARPAITDAAARGNVLRDFIQMRSATNIFGCNPPENWHVPKKGTVSKGK